MFKELFTKKWAPPGSKLVIGNKDVVSKFSLSKEGASYQISVHLMNMASTYGTSNMLTVYHHIKGNSWCYDMADRHNLDERIAISMYNIVSHYGINSIDSYISLIYGENALGK